MSATQSLHRKFCRLRATLLVLIAAAASPLTSNSAQVALTGAVDIQAGAEIACALMANGGVQCWGANSFGQLGDGLPTGVRPVANYVSGLSSGVVAIGVGGAHACAILAAGGGVKCWGPNPSGQLGNGAIGGYQALPVDVVGLGGPAIALALGDSHSCAILADKTVECWGDANSVGHGAIAPQATPLAIPEL